MPRKATTKTVDVKETKTGTTAVKETPKPVKKFSNSDYIMCHSVFPGGLNVNCRSGNYYEFKEYGSVCEIEYRDLVELTRKRSDHIYAPRFIIDDEDFVNEFPQLKKFYEEMYTVNDLKEILTYPADQLRGIIKQLPESILPTLKGLTATMIGNGEIDSVRTIRVLTEIFDVDFNLLSELFSDN